MKISLAWIKDFVKIPEEIDALELGSDLTLHTCEVEKIESSFDGFENIVIGEIKEISAHPNADKLKVVKTDVGNGEVVQIVCGGVNIYVGMKCIVAKLGAKVLWHGDQEMVMEKVKLRGEESNGMICAAEEVRLGTLFKHEKKEVVDLKDIKNIKAGDPVTKLLGSNSIVLEVDNKSLTNRPDLWGHLGIAREIAAIYKVDFKELEEKKFDSGKEVFNVNVIAEDRCPRFQIVKLSGLEVADSPLWMQKRLEEAGVRPISNIVDVTNYVMLELGQPMHAYDAEKVKGGFNIRLSNIDEKFTTLDGVSRKLTGNEVLVCDDEKILGLGGVMGGLSTEVTKGTGSIYLESANWTKTPIRKTSVELGLRTEAVSRYEKGLDPKLTNQAINRAISLLKEMCPSIKIDSKIIDINNYDESFIKIEVSLDKVISVIGIDVTYEQIKDYMERLGFEVVCDDKNVMKFVVPSFRATGDISTEDDIIEEIARLVGYENIVEQDLPITSKYSTKTKQNVLERKMRFLLKNKGFTEVMTYSFVSSALLAKFDEKVDGLLEVLKPLSADLTYLRDSLKNRMLEVVAKNKAENNISIFEIGHVHFKNKRGQDNLPLEDINLCGVITRKKSKKNNKDLFFEVKGILETLLAEFGVVLELKEIEDDLFDLKCEVIVNKKVLGFVGNLGVSVLENYGISKKDVSIFEISLKKLSPIAKDKINYTPLPKYPSVVMGMTLIVPEEVSCGDLVKDINNNNEKLVKSIEIIDIYRGEQIGADKKSVVVDVTYYDDSKTLEDKDVQEVHNKIIKSLSKLGISHR